MVTGGVVGGVSAAPSGRGMLSDTTLVARPLGAGRRSCCAASAPDLRSERTATTAGAQRMDDTVGSGFSNGGSGWGPEVHDKKLHRCAANVQSPGHSRTFP